MILAGGESVVVASGKKAKKTKLPHYVLWTKRSIWNNDGDKAVVKDSDGEVVATVEEKGEGDDEMDDDAAKIVNKDAVEVSLDLIADTVVIKNITTSELNLEGWVIESETGTQSTTLPEVCVGVCWCCLWQVFD